MLGDWGMVLASSPSTPLSSIRSHSGALLGKGRQRCSPVRARGAGYPSTAPAPQAGLVEVLWVL